MSNTFFFAQDQDCHWYMIPSAMREDWQKMTADDTEDQDEIDKFDALFSQYRTGGGIGNIDFTPAKNTFWCIVAYVGANPLYYTGYYKENKPCISVSFEDALKMHSPEAAAKILSELPVSDWKVEEHGY